MAVRPRNSGARHRRRSRQVSCHGLRMNPRAPIARLVSDTRNGAAAAWRSERNRRGHAISLPTGTRSLRTLVRHRSQLNGPTATVTVLAAVSGALSGTPGRGGQSLVAEVTMVKPGVPHAHNHFANATVGLYPELSRQERVERIATDLINARRRSEHPAFSAADRAFAATPAPLLRWGISLFDPDVQPSRSLETPSCRALSRAPPTSHSVTRRAVDRRLPGTLAGNELWFTASGASAIP